MTLTRPNYGRYLLGWLGMWLILTVPTQLPECYERSITIAAVNKSSAFSELLGFAGLRLFMELPCGLMWGSLSWLLQRGTSSIMDQFFAPDFLRHKAMKRLWVGMAAVAVLAFAEAILLGVPLAYTNTSMANFSLAIDDAPAVTITDRSILIESTGILLAFPLACLAAGYFGGVERKAAMIVNAVVEHEEVWPPPPQPS